MRKLVILVSVAVLLAAILAGGCAKPAPAPASSAPAPASAQTLDIGIATPLTGGGGYLGTQMEGGILMAIDDQNNQGGVTIAGQKYVLGSIIRDTKADVVVGKNIAEELVFDKKVKVIAGPFIGDAVGVQSISEPNKVLTFSTSAAVRGLCGPNKPYTFFCSFPMVQTVYKPLAYIKKYYPQAKTVFSVEANDANAPVFVDAAQKCCALLDFNFLGYEKAELTTKDFTPLIARILPKNPDIIDIGSTGGDMGGLCALMIKQIRQAGFNGLIMIPTSPPEDVMEQTVPAESLNKMITIYVNKDAPIVTPAYRDLLVRFDAKYNMEAVAIVALYYNVLKGFFGFLNTQNTMDTTAWMQGFAKYHWQNPWGSESFWIEQVGDGINRRVLTNNWVSHYENGKPITDFSAPIPWDFFVQPSP